MTRAFATLGLAALYLGTLGTVAAADMVVALLVGAALAYRSTPPATGDAWASLRKASALPRFLLGVVIEVLRGSAEMTLVVLGARDWRRQGLLEVELGDRTPLGVTVTALVTGLSPGSVVIEVDWQRRVMLVHVIDATDGDAVRRHIQAFYQRYQAPVFP